jgi:hypothetical protein
MSAFDLKMRQGGDAAVREAAKFFMRDDPVYQTLRGVTARLQELKIPYAVVGGMALVAHGYDRTTADVDILVTAQGLQQVHAQLEALGFVSPFAGSKNLKDVQTNVRIEFLVTGQFPGDGKPKPVAFPDPSVAGMLIGDIHYLRLEYLIEIKLASGMTNAGRLKDLADVQELIRILKLGDDFDQTIAPSVRQKFRELRIAVANNPENPT